MEDWAGKTAKGRNLAVVRKGKSEREEKERIKISKYFDFFIGHYLKG